tara:strand:+ start:2015 stop:2860 length:846 start_codon:yes stop_codon:yes gene_type:complete
MSTIKVEEIQHPSNSNNAVSVASDSSVSLKHSGNQKLVTSSNGVDITGTCTATAFSGDGSALTGLPSSGISGINVQDEGSALSTAATTLDFVGAGVTASGTGATKTITVPGGGGALEFVSRTYVSSTTNAIDLTGFDYERVYKLIFKRGQWGGSSSQNLYVRFFINGGSSPQTAGVYNYTIEHAGGHYTQNNDDKLNFYQYGGENEYVTATFEIYTGYYGYLRGPMHHVGTTNGIRYADIRATLNPSVMTAQRISGVRLYTSNYSDWQVGTEVLLFRYKES